MPGVYAPLRSANFEAIDDELRRLEEAGIDGLPVDVMDGEFCEEVSLPLEQVAPLRRMTRLPMDVHLMVARPDEALAGWIGLPVQRIAIHLASVPGPGAILDEIRAAGITPGLVVLPTTPIADLEPWIGKVGFVNPLGVNPVAKTGYDEATPDRIRELARLREAGGHDFRIQADGGVWEKTRDALVGAGADELVGGYPIFSNNNYKSAVQALRDGA